jgi:hypothetical protein
MNFITGSLPNVMLIAGLIAIGIGLGIEFKIVEIKSEISRQGRMGAIGIGAVLVLMSVYLYTRPPQSASSLVPGVGVPSPAAAANVDAALVAPQPAQAASAPLQAAATSIAPAAVPPTAISVLPAKPPAPTAVPGVKVPDIRGQNIKDAQQMLAAVGLRIGQNQERCEDIGASDAGRKLKKGQIQCQSPDPGSAAAPNTPVLVVIENGGKSHD